MTGMSRDILIHIHVTSVFLKDSHLKKCTICKKKICHEKGPEMPPGTILLQIATIPIDVKTNGD
jgi:hypothetical protein